MNNSKINQAFLSAYINLDKSCAKKLDAKSGVTEYINKLTNLRFAFGRNELLPRLIKYRKLRNRIAHEPGAMKEIDELSRQDISWLKKFEKQVIKGRDPVSKYLKKAGEKARGRALVRAAVLFLAALAVIGAIACAVLFL